MRTIKFRAWESGKLYYQVRCGGEFDGIPTAPTVWNESAGDWLNLTGQPYTKVMQFTGLHDKNGREIYEGDIVKGYWWDRGKKHRHIGRVAYVMNAFNVRGVKQYLGYDDGLNPSYEVIGNIYENPELAE